MQKMAKKRLLDTSVVDQIWSSASNNPMVVCPADKRLLVQLITAFNPNSSPEVLSVFRVPDAAGAVGTADLSTNRMFRIEINPSESLTIELPGGGWVLEHENDSVQFAIATNPVVVAVDGAEVS